MRVAVTGASGFLGSHIALGLSARGHEVVGVVRNPERASWLAERGITLKQADLRDRASLARACSGLDAVVSNAAPASDLAGADVDAFVQADCAATDNVIGAALDSGIPRFIHISSVAVYQLYWPCQRVSEDHRRRSGHPLDLTRLVTRRGYAESKARSEERVWEAMSRGLHPTVLRPGPIYGSRDGKLTARLLRASTSRLRIVPTVGVPHVHAGDVAQAVCGALDNPASCGRAYNVTGEPVSLYTLAGAVREVTGASGWLLPLPVPLWLGWDNTAATRDLGVRYRPLRDGLVEALRST